MWFIVLIFCFAVNVAVCDTGRFEFLVSVAQKIGCIERVNWMIVQLFCVCVCCILHSLCIWYCGLYCINPKLYTQLNSRAID